MFKGALMVMAIISLSVMAQDFSDGYRLMIQLGLIHNDSLSQKDTTNADTAKVVVDMILFKDMATH